MDTYKIAYILTPVDFGGSEKVSLNFLRNVDRKKFEIIPILLNRPWENQNIFIDKLKREKYNILTVPVAKRSPSEGKDLFRVVRCCKLTYSILQEGSFDLVHTHGYFADVVGIPAARLLGISTISTCHGYIENNRTMKIYNILDRIVLRMANRILAVSEEIKDELIKHRIKDSHIRVITNSVNTNENVDNINEKCRNARKKYSIDDKDFVVGYLGRLSVEKGIIYIIDAVKMLKNDNVPIKLLLIGEGPQRNELELLVKNNGIEDKVIFTGFQKNIDKWIAIFDVFTLPSLREGTPMSLLEVMAYGVPVIATAVGGIPRIIQPDQNGILTSPGNSLEIKNAIASIYNNEPFRVRLGQEAKKTIKSRYNFKNWIKKMEYEYSNILENN